MAAWFKDQRAARIDRGDKAAEIDDGLNHGRPAVQDAMAKQGSRAS